MNAVDYFFHKTYFLEKEVLVSSREKKSYRELSSMVNALSLWLRENYEQGTPVLLLSPNNVFFVVAYLAIMKAGCVCVPVNPIVESAGFLFVTEKTKASVAFLHSTVAARLKPEIAYLDEQKTEQLLNSLEQGTYLPGPELETNALAQIIFTSGSTSVPKGVMLTHENLIANTTSILDYLHLTEDDTMLVVLPFFIVTVCLCCIRI